MRTGAVLLLAALVAAFALYGLARDPAPPRGQTEVAPVGTPRAPDPAEPAPVPAPSHPFRCAVLVTDEESRPLAGARVESRCWGGRIDLIDSAVSGADGRCAVGYRAEPQLLLLAEHPEYAGASRSEPVPCAEATLVLRRGARVTFVVETREARPISGATVKAYALEGEEFRSWASGVDGRRTGEDGRVAIVAMPGGRVRARVDHSEYAPASDEFDVPSREPIERRIRLERGGAIAGRVTDVAGNPVGGARVAGFAGGVHRETTTAADGSYLLSALPDGEVHVTARAEGFAPGFFGESIGWGEAVPARVPAGQLLRGIDVELNVPSYVVGRAVDAQGAPIPALEALAYRSRGPWYEEVEARSDPEGAFRIGPVDARNGADLVVDLRAPGHRFRNVRVALRAGETLDVGEVRAAARGVVRGRVVDAEERPVAGAAVQASGEIAATRADGSFEFLGMPAGEIALAVRRSGGAGWVRHPEPVRVEEGGVVEGLLLRLGEALAIAGRVLTPRGDPRAGVEVAAVPSELQSPYAFGTMALAHTDAEGAFRIDGLAAGRYRVGLPEPRWEGGRRHLREAPRPVETSAGAADVELVVPLKGGVAKGRALRADGTPLRGFRVESFQHVGPFPRRRDLEWFEDVADGRFSVELESPGTWAIEVEADGAAPLRTDTFRIAEGETKDLGDLRLGEGGRLRATVRDTAGRPVPYARVYALSPKFQVNEEAPFTDEGGVAEVEGLAPGTYNVFGVSPVHPIGVAKGVQVPERGTPRVEIRLPPTCPLRVVVRDENGRPVEGVDLAYAFEAALNVPSRMFRSFEPPGFGAHETDANGEIWKRCLPPGEVRIFLQREGFEPFAGTVELAEGQTRTLEVVLRRPR